jgi:hypothetical protein
MSAFGVGGPFLKTIGPASGEEQGVAAVGVADLLLLEHGHGDAPRPSL